MCLDSLLAKFLLQSSSGPNYHREVPLSEILAVDSAKKINGEEQPFSFVLRTANVDYFVCEAPGQPSELQSWESHIRQALQPPGDNVTTSATAEAGGEEVVFPDSEVEAAEAELDTLAAQQAQPLPVLENIEQNYDEIPVNGLYQAPQ